MPLEAYNVAEDATGDATCVEVCISAFSFSFDLQLYYWNATLISPKWNKIERVVDLFHLLSKWNWLTVAALQGKPNLNTTPLLPNSQPHDTRKSWNRQYISKTTPTPHQRHEPTSLPKTTAWCLRNSWWMRNQNQERRAENDDQLGDRLQQVSNIATSPLVDRASVKHQYDVHVVYPTNSDHHLLLERYPSTGRLLAQPIFCIKYVQYKRPM